MDKRKLDFDALDGLLDSQPGASATTIPRAPPPGATVPGATMPGTADVTQRTSQEEEQFRETVLAGGETDLSRSPPDPGAGPRRVVVPLVIVAALAVLGLAGWWLWSSASTPGAPPAPTPIAVAEHQGGAGAETAAPRPAGDGAGASATNAPEAAVAEPDTGPPTKVESLPADPSPSGAQPESPQVAVAARGETHERPAADEPAESLEPVAPEPMLFPASFTLGGTRPRTVDREAFNALVAKLKTCGRKVRVLGESCDLGSRGARRRVATGRARSVRNALVAAGIPGRRLKTGIVPLNASDHGEPREARRRVTLVCEPSS